MRNFKFRAWDGVSDFFYFDIFSMECFIASDIQQCTCLEDKNGKEIYEGDIIEYKDSICDGYREYTVIRKKEVSYGIGIYWAGSYELYKVRHEGEIIGNIYENPELIES